MNALKMKIPANVTSRLSTMYVVPVSLPWVPASIVWSATL